MNEWVQGLNELMRQAALAAGAGLHLRDRIDRLHYFVFIVTMVSSVGGGPGVGLLLLPLPRAAEERLDAQGGPQRAVRDRRHRHPAVLLPGLGRTSASRTTSGTRTPPKEAMDVYVTGKKWMWHFAYPDGPNANATLHRARPPPGAAADDQPGRDPLVLRPRVPHQAGRASPAATPRPGSRRPSPAATGSTAPSTAAPGTRRWWARWWSWSRPTSTSGWPSRRQGLAERADTSGGAEFGQETFRGDLVDARPAAWRRCTAASSATPSTAQPHIGPTWMDLYRRPDHPADRRDHRRRRGLPHRVDDGPYLQDGEGLQPR